MIPDDRRSGRFGGVRFRLAGIEVELQLIFIAWIAALGLISGREGVTLVAWIVIAALAVLIHELGHAFAYRAYGVQPRIVLAALFGLTYGEELPPARSFVVSIAGPATGVVIGIVALALQAIVGTADPVVATALGDLVFVGLGWAVLNVLPILPLDGGQAVRAVLGAAGRADANRLSLLLSIGAAVVIAIAGIAAGYLVLVVFMAWFAAGNVAELAALGEDRLRGDLNRLGRQLMRGDADGAIAGLEDVERLARSGSLIDAARAGRGLALLSAGRWEEAEAALRRLSDPSQQPLLAAAIDLHRGRVDPGLMALLAERTDAVAAMGAARAILDTGHVDDALVQTEGLPGGDADRALRMLVVGLHFVGGHEEAIRVAELLARRQPGWNEVAYFAASSLAALGRFDESLSWLGRAADLGATYDGYLDRDPRLDPVRALPEYAAVRERFALNAAGTRPTTGELLGDDASDVGARA